MDRCREEVPGSYEAEGRHVKCFLYEPGFTGIRPASMEATPVT
jgi:hypothetical protein